MTLGKLKNKIYSILGLSGDAEVPALCFVIDGVIRKVSSLCGGTRKTATVTFSQIGNMMCADEPANYLRGAVVIGFEGAEIYSDGEKLCAKSLDAGTYTVAYYALPDEITEASPDETELDTSDVISEASSYGAAGELCSKLYPGDVRRYMEIMTEYDERMSGICRDSIRAVSDSVFSRARGVR